MNLGYSPSFDFGRLIRDAIKNLSQEAKQIYSINLRPQPFKYTDRIKDLNELTA